MNTNEIKSELRRFKKVKKHLRRGEEKYKEVKNKIKELNDKLEKTNQSNPEKDKLIIEIENLTESFFRGIIDYKQYTIKQLEFHLNKLKERKIT